MKQLLLPILFCITFSIHAQHLPLKLVDERATNETNSLYQHLGSVAGTAILFGHQDTDAYGARWKNDAGRSDVKDLCGSHAAIHGWDLGNEQHDVNLDSVPFASIRHFIIEAYRRGGINTISWHLTNPVTGESAWARQPVVADVIPGGQHHKAYVKKLETVSSFLNSLEYEGVKVPIIFRPFHEHNGDWFWWGKGNCSESEYITLFRFTVDYLKNTKGLHHLIYAFSPDRSRMDLGEGAGSYLYGYPGDDYVDLIGLDNYMDVGVKWNTRSQAEQREDFKRSLTIITNVAKEKRKVAALTETGLEGVSNPSWFTSVILDIIKNNPAISVSYVLLWRNANSKHHYVPYPGHSAANDFLKFYNDSFTLFESDLENVYGRSSVSPATENQRKSKVESSSIKQ